jgi:hypothetical protein
VAVLLVGWRQARQTGRLGLLLWLLALGAAWELVTETYVIWRAGRAYVAALRMAPNPSAFLFWPLMLLLAALPLLAPRRRWPPDDEARMRPWI